MVGEYLRFSKACMAETSAHRYRRTVHWTRSSGVIELSMDGRKVRMSDVPSKDCNGVLRMQVMIAKSGGSVVARYGPDRASARACILFTTHTANV